MRLEQLLERSAAEHPLAVAAFESTGQGISYAGLEAYSDAVSRALADVGVSAGDRVGVCTPKCIATLASLFGAMKAGAAYVPVDHTAPAARNAYIFGDCQVSAIILERKDVEVLTAALPGAWREAPFPDDAQHRADFAILAPAGGAAAAKAPDLAYILYTSGSTGKPKGVMHSHSTALAFVDWCSGEFEPGPDDRFSSHAPFHFDLSILDIYVPIKHGAAVVLIGSDAGKQPATLTKIIAELGISVWYSTPSILRLILEYGNVAEHDCSRLRIVNFAGEVFPIKHLRALTAAWGWPKYYNLYGPTETNVCTYYGFSGRLPDGEAPLPIGRKCSGDDTRVVDPEGRVVPRGEQGELVVTGGSVMLGYWNLPANNAEAFLELEGARWYRTGDIVYENAAGDYIFVGRRDRMVKRRGFRVELGEIEAALHRHPAIPEAAAIARAGAEGDVEIVAFCSWAGEDAFSTVKMKQFCARNLPHYMSPDRFVALQELPKTSTDKINYQLLKDMA